MNYAIQMPRHQRKEKDSPVSQQEHTELRGLLGGLGWKCEQTGPQHSAATGLERSRVEQATVQDLTEANPTEERFALFGWGEAALQNKIDGRSTQGLLFTCSSATALQGQDSWMSVFSWKSGRVDGVSGSATCAETRAIVDLEDELLRCDVNDLKCWTTPLWKIHMVKWHDGTWRTCD